MDNIQIDYKTLALALLAANGNGGAAQMLTMKDIDSRSVLPRDVPVAKPLADNGSVLALDEGVVVGLPCAALRL